MTKAIKATLFGFIIALIVSVMLVTVSSSGITASAATASNTVSSNLLRTNGKFNISTWTEPADKTAYAVIEDDFGSGAVNAYKATNPADGSRVVTTADIKVSGTTKKAATAKFNIKISQLATGRKVGLALGLSTATTSLSDQGVSYFHFYKEADGTYFAVSKGGVSSQGTKLTTDYITTKAAISVLLTAASNGDVEVLIGEQKINFTAQNISGFAAIGALGSGDATYSIGDVVEINYYVPTAGTGKDIKINFNAAYIDGTQWAIQQTSTSHFKDPSKSVGIAFEEGSLFFKGTYDDAFFATMETYADFITEFDYVSIPLAQRPELVSSWTDGYSWAGFSFAKAEKFAPHASGNMVLIYDYNFGGESFVEFYEYNKSKLKIYIGGEHQLKIFEKTTKFKLVVFDNECIVYGVNMGSDGNPIGDYIKVGSYTYKDTLGHASFTSTNCGYFKLDNVKIKNIDGKYSNVQQALDDYEDFVAIEDEYEALPIDTPEIKLNTTTGTVSWSAINHASGYKVTVNGRVSELITALNYKIITPKSGDYVVTVQAIANSDKNEELGFIYAINSENSNSVTYTAVVAEVIEPEPDTDESPKKGCKSEIGGVSVAVALVFVSVACIFVAVKKRRHE